MFKFVSRRARTEKWKLSEKWDINTFLLPRTGLTEKKPNRRQVYVSVRGAGGNGAGKDLILSLRWTFC
ncbi:hypothetical protein J6590_024134 [Homalodisca vitripennis]|nr:hypothetical protein J6590_024134 [Homalodisca vitripennis]